MDDTFREKCEAPISIGEQQYAYQCETVGIHPLPGSVKIYGWPPTKGGKLPYPNEEKNIIQGYDLEISQFTNNSLEIKLTKRKKDGTETLYLTGMSFAELTNRLFEGARANVFDNPAAPKKPVS